MSGCIATMTVLAVAGLSVAFRPSDSIGSDDKPRYTNDWAVEVRGGPEAADALASNHGFLNRGQVGIYKRKYTPRLILFSINFIRDINVQAVLRTTCCDCIPEVGSPGCIEIVYVHSFCAFMG